MLPRKTEHADLEHKKSIFLEIGLIVSLGVVFVLMELNFKSERTAEIQGRYEVSPEEEMVPITRQEQKAPPPPKNYAVMDILNIVDDEVSLEEELEILDSETNQDEEVELVEMPDVGFNEEEGEEPIFIVVEEMPVFRPEICKNAEEGKVELMKYISKSIRYPVVAAENGIQGRVYVTFVVSVQGTVTDVMLTRGVHPALDKEAIRVVQLLPGFSPGKQRGKPVRVQYSVPINFVLQ